MKNIFYILMLSGTMAVAGPFDSGAVLTSENPIFKVSSGILLPENLISALEKAPFDQLKNFLINFKENLSESFWNKFNSENLRERFLRALFRQGLEEEYDAFMVNLFRYLGPVNYLKTSHYLETNVEGNLNAFMDLPLAIQKHCFSILSQMQAMNEIERTDSKNFYRFYLWLNPRQSLIQPLEEGPMPSFLWYDSQKIPPEYLRAAQEKLPQLELHDLRQLDWLLDIRLPSWNDPSKFVSLLDGPSPYGQAIQDLIQLLLVVHAPEQDSSILYGGKDPLSIRLDPKDPWVSYLLNKYGLVLDGDSDFPFGEGFQIWSPKIKERLNDIVQSCLEELAIRQKGQHFYTPEFVKKTIFTEFSGDQNQTILRDSALSFLPKKSLQTPLEIQKFHEDLLQLSLLKESEISGVDLYKNFVRHKMDLDEFINRFADQNQDQRKEFLEQSPSFEFAQRIKPVQETFLRLMFFPGLEKESDQWMNEYFRFLSSENYDQSTVEGNMRVFESWPTDIQQMFPSLNSALNEVYAAPEIKNYGIHCMWIDFRNRSNLSNQLLIPGHLPSEIFDQLNQSVDTGFPTFLWYDSQKVSPQAVSDTQKLIPGVQLKDLRESPLIQSIQVSDWNDPSKKVSLLDVPLPFKYVACDLVRTMIGYEQGLSGQVFVYQDLDMKPFESKEKLFDPWTRFLLDRYGLAMSSGPGIFENGFQIIGFNPETLSELKEKIIGQGVDKLNDMIVKRITPSTMDHMIWNLYKGLFFKWNEKWEEKQKTPILRDSQPYFVPKKDVPELPPTRIVPFQKA